MSITEIDRNSVNRPRTEQNVYILYYISCCQSLWYCIALLRMRKHSCILWMSVPCKMLLYTVVSCISVSYVGSCSTLSALNVMRHPAFCFCFPSPCFQYAVNLNLMKSFDQVHLTYICLSCLTAVLLVHASQGPDIFCSASCKFSVESWDP